MFDLRSFSLPDMYRCSAELRRLGEELSDVDEGARRVVSYLFESLRRPETNTPDCALVRFFRTLPRSQLSSEDAAVLDADVPPSTPCLSLRATRGIERSWNDPGLSKRHRLIPLTSRSAIAKMPMVEGLISQLGLSRDLLAGRPREDPGPLPRFNVFHVERARNSVFVPDQRDFVGPYGIESVLGFGGILPPSQVFVVLLFATVTIPKSTAELFRTVAASVELALLAYGRDIGTLETRSRAYALLLRHHEDVALNAHRQLELVAGQLAASLAARQRFEALVENSPDFIGMAEVDGRGIYLNPAGRRMVGLGPDFDVTKACLNDFYAPEDRRHMEEVVFPSTLREGRWTGEAVLRHRTTNVAISVSDNHFCIRESDTQRVLCVGAILRDISERRRADEERERLLASAHQARAEAQAATCAKDDFLASLGHELRNPLAPILTAVELMKLRGDRTRERDIIERQAVHLARLVDDLLDVARIARGKIQVELKPTELATVVAQAVEVVSPAIAQRKQHLKVDVPPHGLLVSADVGRLAQVVSNLLDNASKFSPPGSDVEVSAERRGARLRLRVVDHGMGIPHAMLGRIFESFVQYRQRDDARVGLGLGLAIARNIVALHGGHIVARSEGPGTGSEFAIELPLLKAAAATTTTSNHRAGPSVAGRTKRVLLVDDNADAACALGDALTELGHEVLVAEDGPAALEVAPSFKPEIALIDIGLPRMDGYELARRLQRLPGMPHGLRLIAVTGFGQEKDRREALAAGFAEHLVKPVALDALMAAVRA
ncbi:MAG TPA: ATP-binding protein [Labilithrix sp.]|nr:ATP-binding protein [Labilithrix sp.]